MRRVPNRKYHRDDQQSAVRLHHAARAAEIGQALDPAPIVDDMGKQLSTGSGGNALKEVVSFELMRSASPLA